MCIEVRGQEEEIKDSKEDYKRSHGSRRAVAANGWKVMFRLMINKLQKQ